jgi:hypothetical protein
MCVCTCLGYDFYSAKICKSLVILFTYVPHEQPFIAWNCWPLVIVCCTIYGIGHKVSETGSVSIFTFQDRSNLFSYIHHEDEISITVFSKS